MPSFEFTYDPVKDPLIYTYKESNKLVDLRKRIIKIAASYVGQVNIRNANGPFSFNDPEFQKKMVNIGWYPSYLSSAGKKVSSEWCNYFCRLVYAEAFYGGNAIPSLSGPSAYTDISNFTKNSSGTYKISLSGSNSTPYQHSYYGALDATVGHTVSNFLNHLTIGSRWIDLAGDLSEKYEFVYNQNESGVINSGKKNLFKKFIAAKAILPGDLMIFDWENDLKEGNGKVKGAQHIGIYVGGSDDTMVIDGNMSNKVKYRSPGIKDIRGICQLTTTNNP